MTKTFSFSIIPILFLTFWLESCTTANTSENETTSSVNTPTTTPSVNSSPTPKVFESESVTSNVSKETPVENLIPATPPSEKVQTIKVGKPDPFSTIPVTPILTKESPILSKEQPILTKDSPKESNNKIDESVEVSNDQVTQKRCTIKKEEFSLDTFEDPGTLGVTANGMIQLPTGPVAIITPPGGLAIHVKKGEVFNGILVKNIYTDGSILLEKNSRDFYISPGVDGGEENSAKNFSVGRLPGPEPYGMVRDLILNEVTFGEQELLIITKDEESKDTDFSTNATEKWQASVEGTVCNNSKKTTKVSSITLQIEDKNQTVLDSVVIPLGEASFILDPGYAGAFDREVILRRRLEGEIIIKLRDWG
jgi:hypothetical protein